MGKTDKVITQLDSQMRLAVKHHSSRVTKQEVVYDKQPAELLVAYEKVIKNNKTYYDEFVSYTRSGEKFPFLTILIEGAKKPEYKVGQRFEIGMFLYANDPKTGNENYDVHLMQMNPDGSADFSEIKLNAADDKTSINYRRSEPYLAVFTDIASRVVYSATTKKQPA